MFLSIVVHSMRRLVSNSQLMATKWNVFFPIVSFSWIFDIDLYGGAHFGSIVQQSPKKVSKLDLKSKQIQFDCLNEKFGHVCGFRLKSGRFRGKWINMMDGLKYHISVYSWRRSEIWIFYTQFNWVDSWSVFSSLTFKKFI